MQQLVLLGNTIMHTTTYARYGRLSKTTFIEYCPLLQGDIVTFCVAFATQDINFRFVRMLTRHFPLKMGLVP